MTKYSLCPYYLTRKRILQEDLTAQLIKMLKKNLSLIVGEVASATDILKVAVDI
jgi:hypothetical protein